METYEHDFAQAEARVRRLRCSGCRSTASRCVCIDDANVREILPDDRRSRSSPTASPKTRDLRATDVANVGGRMRFVARREAAARPGRRAQRCPACTTCATRSPRSPSGAKSACARCGDREGARRIPRRRPPLPALRRRRARRRRRLHADRRLRPSPGRDGGDARRGARRAFPGRRLVLAFQPHRYTRTRDLFEDFVARAVDRRRAGAGRCLSGRRGADRRAPTAARSRARCASPARSSRYSSKTSPTSPAAIRALARDGDVVRDDGRRLHRRRCRCSCAARMMMNEPLPASPVLRGTLEPRRAARALHELALRRPRRPAVCTRGSRRPRRCSCASCPPREPLIVLGLGSNTLVRDGGVRGTVVIMHNPARRARGGRRPDLRGGRRREPESSRASPRCTAARTRSSWRASRAPIGGALAMNAGLLRRRDLALRRARRSRYAATAASTCARRRTT